MTRLDEKIIEASDETFDYIIKSKEKVVAIVGTQWCTDTRRMVCESLPAVMERYGEMVSFVYVLLEKADHRKINPVLDQKLKVFRYPTIISFKKGVEKSRKISEGDVEKQIRDLLLTVNSLIIGS